MGEPFIASMQKMKATLDENVEEQFGKFENLEEQFGKLIGKFAGWREELLTDLRSMRGDIAVLLEGQREAELELQTCAQWLAAHEASQATNSLAAGSVPSELVGRDSDETQ